MKKFMLFVCLCLPVLLHGQWTGKVISISDNVQLKKITPNIYLVQSFKEFQQWGRVNANGLLYISENEITMINTPWDTTQTKDLLNYVDTAFKKKFARIIVTHSHDDCMGGLKEIKKRKIKSLTYKETIEKALVQKLPIPDSSFADSIFFKDIAATAYYFGKGHTSDNIVVWFENEKILYGGCLVKDINSSGLGNTAEAYLKDWPFTILRILNKFRTINYVIPGHGEVGGYDLLEHTLKLTRK